VDYGRLLRLNRRIPQDADSLVFFIPTVLVDP
jgi:hypothetical protein